MFYKIDGIFDITLNNVSFVLSLYINLQTFFIGKSIMRKITSWASLLLAGLMLVGCAGKKDEFAGVAAETLYEKGQGYMQSGDWNSAIRHLEALNGRQAGVYGEQTQLSLIYAQYKVGEYYKALEEAERFVRTYPDNANMDYVYYLAALSNVRLGDNFIQDFFKINRSSRAVESVHNAYGSFQTIVNEYPQSRYVNDAQQWLAYLKNRLAEHELEIAKFYIKREAYVAAANRIEELLKLHPESKAAYDALPLLKLSFEKMGIVDSAKKVETMMIQKQGSSFPEIVKPAYADQF